MRAGWGGIRLARVYDLAPTTCAKAFITYIRVTTLASNILECVSDWYFSLISRAIIQVLASYPESPFTFFFSQFSPRKIQDSGTGLYSMYPLNVIQ
jgi:hypothetical protein